MLRDGANPRDTFSAGVVWQTIGESDVSGVMPFGKARYTSLNLNRSNCSRHHKKEILMEARVGFEPTRDGFADGGSTT